MVGGADNKSQGRRGSKKARGRAGGGNNGGGNGGRNNKGDNGGGAGAGVDAGQSFPVVSDSRFSSMHSAPVSVGYGSVLTSHATATFRTRWSVSGGRDMWRWITRCYCRCPARVAGFQHSEVPLALSCLLRFLHNVSYTCLQRTIPRRSH